MTDVAVFGGGCFWCIEAVFKMLHGVTSVAPGYAGGTTQNPRYWDLHSKDTGHAEVIQVEFDPAVIRYHDLLSVFFGSHDATQVNRQGADVGTEYRSLILYTTDAQKVEAEAYIADLNASSTTGKLIATEVAPLTAFYPAEAEHLDFYNRNRGSMYCELVIEPKLAKAQKAFANLLKNQAK
jgi:peptide-methionine (S)-S-oxide reductase